MTSEYVPPTRERLIELAAQLYDLGRDNEPFTSKGGPQPLAKIPAVFATGRHAIECGKAAADLVGDGRELLAMTMVRSALECAITALWLVQSSEAIFGFLGEDVRGRRNLSREMAKSVNASYRDGAPSVAHVDDETIETIAAPQARNFQQLCNALKGGHEAYLHYRILSGLVHPCASLTDHYLEPNDESPAGLTLRFQPSGIGHDSWLFLGVACMTWAHRAIDHLDARHVHRSYLRAVARELQVPETLALTEEAEQAIFLQQQQRRREARLRK